MLPEFIPKTHHLRWNNKALTVVRVQLASESHSDGPSLTIALLTEDMTIDLRGVGNDQSFHLVHQTLLSTFCLDPCSSEAYGFPLYPVITGCEMHNSFLRPKNTHCLLMRSQREHHCGQLTTAQHSGALFWWRGK